MRRFHIGSIEWSPPRVPVHLPFGEGSLGWLLHLVRRGRLNLPDILLAPIAEACLEYWREGGDLDEVSDAVAALAYLAERKAARLLASPEPEEEEEEEAELAPPTLPSPFRAATEQLRALEANRALIFFRRAEPDAEDYEVPIPFGELEANLLVRALQGLLACALPELSPIPQRPEFSLQLRMIEILHQLDRAQAPLRFEAFLPEESTRLDVVFYFLTLLELVRLGQVKVQVSQEEPGAGVTILVSRGQQGSTSPHP